MSTGYIHPLSVTFESIACSKCGILFAVDAQVRAVWKRDGTTFTCPNGHGQSYTETEAQKLKKQLEIKDKELQFARKNAASERAAREQTQRQLAVRKGINTRLRNRIRHGVCPCCHRTLQLMI